MYRIVFKVCRVVRLLLCPIVFSGLMQAMPTHAAQTDIHGPPGSGAFGMAVAVLPNGNIVVTDPWVTSRRGAVYLYTPAGVLINSFSGTNDSDMVGSGGITVLKNGNYVISSPSWANGAGAVTWVNGSTGLSGVVSAENSLVGGATNSEVGVVGALESFRGHHSVTELSNGNYVVNSTYWANGAAAGAGAVTWANGSTGLSGVVSAANSLVGMHANDNVGIGGVTVLSNGNYVVDSFIWANGAVVNAGAVTWANGSTGTFGAVSAANSLVGTRELDYVGGGCANCFSQDFQPDFGGVTALTNGNFVVASPNWANGEVISAGAATWVNGATGLSGAVSAANSLVGVAQGDLVGIEGATALRSGNYVVGSSFCSAGGVTLAGAATWANGSTGLSGTISITNSLVGIGSGDRVGFPGVTALSNGNYVVASAQWNNSTESMHFGAATWANGSTGLSGWISIDNSLVGTTANDQVGNNGVTALVNGNYVVKSSSWSNGAARSAGAATWMNGNTKSSGTVSTANSLVGTQALDFVGSSVTALSNGNYVVKSYAWANGAAQLAGAATWANGSTGLSGAVSPANSLVGTTAGDYVGGGGVTALSNGNYVVVSSFWTNGMADYSHFGAVTWGNGNTGISGPVSASNSLVGTTGADFIGITGVTAGLTALSNGNYVVDSPEWANGTTLMAGAVTLGSGNGGLVGPIVAANSVLGTTYQGGIGLVSAYDPVRYQLVVGQPANNLVSLFPDPSRPPIAIDGYMSGNWFNSQQAGHGFQIEAATNNVMVAIWFVYAPDGSGQNWIYAQGTYDKTSSTVTLPAIMLTGAKFPPNFNPGDVTQTAWGNLTFSFTDCNNGTATWSSPLPGYGMGSLPITRLTQIAGTTCPP
jgi:Repeat of unknown function (DUF5650)